VAFKRGLCTNPFKYIPWHILWFVGQGP
jgi:hypothetical protein